MESMSLPNRRAPAWQRRLFHRQSRTRHLPLDLVSVSVCHYAPERSATEKTIPFPNRN